MLKMLVEWPPSDHRVTEYKGYALVTDRLCKRAAGNLWVGDHGKVTNPRSSLCSAAWNVLGQPTVPSTVQLLASTSQGIRQKDS